MAENHLDCERLLSDYYVCVGAAGTSTPQVKADTSGPSPTQLGIASNCE